MSKAGGEAAADGDKKYTVNNLFLIGEKSYMLGGIGFVRHEQKRNAES